MTEIRKGQAPAVLSRNEFHQRFIESFMDPAFRAEDEAISRVEAIAWGAYEEGRKAPITQKAGAAYADPDYDMSVEWLVPMVPAIPPCLAIGFAVSRCCIVLPMVLGPAGMATAAGMVRIENFILIPSFGLVLKRLVKQVTPAVSYKFGKARAGVNLG